MLSNTKEKETVDYNFILIAEQYLESSVAWNEQIGGLLEKLNDASGSEISCLIQFKQDGILHDIPLEVNQSWMNSNSIGSCRYSKQTNLISDYSQKALTGQPFHISLTDLENQYPEAKADGVNSISLFPLHVQNQLWGMLCQEFYGFEKKWTPVELKVMDLFTSLLDARLETLILPVLEENYNFLSEPLFEHLPAAMVILSPDGTVEKINQEFTQLFQYTPAEIVGNKLDDILPAAEERKIAWQLTVRILEGERIVYEGKRFRKDGSEVFVSVNGVVSTATDGRLIIYTIYHDITERLLAQEKLKESQARFRLLFESANDAIFILKDGFVIDCNARTLDIFNCTRPEILGKSALELSPIRQPNGLLSLHQAVKYFRAALGKEQQSLEWMHKRPDGSTFMAEVSINVFEFKGEIYTQAIVRDISSRKHTDQLLKQRYEFIAFLSKVSADMINPDSGQIKENILEILSYSCKYTSCTRSLVYLLNAEGTKVLLSQCWDAEGLVRMPVLEQVLFSDLPGIFVTLQQGETLVKAVPKEPKTAEDLLISEIFDLGNFDSYALIPLSVGNKFIGFTAYFSARSFYGWTDDLITPLKLTNQLVANALERNRVEFELMSAKEQAVESDKLKTAFLSSMSHEIRTPMNHILGFIELLKDPTLLDTEKKEFMEIIKSSGNILLRLIDDIIDIAKLESGQLVINQVELSLSKFVNEIYYIFSEQVNTARKGNIQFEVYVPTVDTTNTIKTDPLRLQQIVSNLLSNAIKFTTEGKVCFGYTIQPENRIHFFVEDTGIGIPAEKHKEVFERFRQLDGRYSREFGGTGLGLAIAKGLVELMSGEIGLESEPGKGSRFYFTIPFKPVIEKEEPVTERVLTAHEYDFSGKNILVVEDDEINYRFLEIVIQRTNARAFRAVTGAEAIDQALKLDIDLILMDIQIPVIDGYLATSRIKEAKPQIPIIAQTAHALTEEKEKCLRSGADDYLSKPIGRKELLSKMAVYLFA